MKGYFFAKIMMKFQKDYNAGLLRIAFIIDTICVILFFTGILYAFSSTNDILRLPIGKEDDTYARMETEMPGQSGDDNVRPSTDLFRKLTPYKNEFDLIVSLGVNKGDRVIEVGGASLISTGLLVLAYGGRYIGVEIDRGSWQYANNDIRTGIEKYNLLRYGGSIDCVNDDFVNYAKKNVGDSTIRFVIAIAVISEPMATIDKQGKIFEEMLRIVQNGGEIILGRFPTAYEIKHEKRVIDEILISDKYRQRVGLTLIEERPLYRNRTYSRYLVTKIGDSSIGNKLKNMKGSEASL